MSDHYTEARRMIESHFASRWAAIGNPLPIAWENAPFNQPKSGKWLNFSVRFGLALQTSLGSRPVEKIPGVVIAQIFCPKNLGTRETTGHAQAVANAMNYTQLVAVGIVVDLTEASLMPTGERKDYYQQNVEIKFQAQRSAEARTVIES